MKKITKSMGIEITHNIRVIERDNLQALFDALAQDGRQLLGPTVRNGAVVLDEIEQAADLPVGLTDHHDGGRYRLEEAGRPSCFGCVVGPQSWKKYLHEPQLTLWQVARSGRSYTLAAPEGEAPKRALIGVRACDLAAIAIHDKVLLAGPYVDANYARQRENLFIVAVNCTRAGGTCFCASLGTGPAVTGGYDLALTELLDGSRHRFVVDVGSKAGEKILEKIPHTEATPSDISAATAVVEAAASGMGRRLDAAGLKERLYRAVEHPHWAEIAERCLTCGNCTMVCPTCFCTTVEDWTALGGESAERSRRWDSCFTVDFSYIYGGSIRPSASARYRQWLLHKLAGWVDQFGVIGCVGCGRCITWCPVGIDITEEVRAFDTFKPSVGAHA